MLAETHFLLLASQILYQYFTDPLFAAEMFTILVPKGSREQGRNEFATDRGNCPLSMTAYDATTCDGSSKMFSLPADDVCGSSWDHHHHHRRRRRRQRSRDQQQGGIQGEDHLGGETMLSWHISDYLLQEKIVTKFLTITGFLMTDMHLI